MAKVIKSFRLTADTIEMLQALRKPKYHFSPELLESEATTIERLIWEAYRQRNTNPET